MTLELNNHSKTAQYQALFSSTLYSSSTKEQHCSLVKKNCQTLDIRGILAKKANLSCLCVSKLTVSEIKMMNFNFILLSFSFLFSVELFYIFYFENSRVRAGVMVGHTITSVTTMIMEHKEKK